MIESCFLIFPHFQKDEVYLHLSACKTIYIFPGKLGPKCGKENLSEKERLWPEKLETLGWGCRVEVSEDLH